MVDSKHLGSIDSRCSAKWARTHPPEGAAGRVRFSLLVHYRQGQRVTRPAVSVRGGSNTRPWRRRKSSLLDVLHGLLLLLIRRWAFKSVFLRSNSLNLREIFVFPAQFALLSFSANGRFYVKRERSSSASSHHRFPGKRLKTSLKSTTWECRRKPEINLIY